MRSVTLPVTMGLVNVALIVFAVGNAPGYDEAYLQKVAFLGAGIAALQALFFLAWYRTVPNFGNHSYRVRYPTTREIQNAVGKPANTANSKSIRKNTVLLSDGRPPRQEPVTFATSAYEYDEDKGYIPPSLRWKYCKRKADG